MKNSRKGIYNILFSIGYKLIAVVVSFVVPKLFITNYGSAVNGLQGSVAQLFTYVGLLEAGIGDASVQALFRPIADKNYDSANGIISATSKYYNKISSYYFIILLVAGIGYALFVPVEGLNFTTVFLYVIVYGSVTGVNFLYWSKINVLMKATGDVFIISGLNIFSYLINTTLKIVVLMMCWNVVWIQVAYLFTSLLITYICYRYVKKHYAWLDFKSIPNKKAINKKNYALAHNVNYVIFSSIDVTVLTILCDLKTVSIYTTYRMIVNALSGLTTPFIDGIYFILGQTYKDEDTHLFAKMIDTVNVYYSALSFALFTIMYLLMESFMRLYTAKFTDANYIIAFLPLLYIIIEVLMVGRELMNRVVNIAGHYKETWHISMTETIINVVTSVLLVAVLVGRTGKYEYGLYGVLIGTVISVLYRTVAINIYANKHILKRSSWFTFKIMFINVATFSVIAILMYKGISGINNYGSFVIKAIPISLVVIAIYLINQTLLNPKQVKEIISIIKNRSRLKNGKG